MEQKKGGEMKIWILVFLILATIFDFKDFRIPNWLNAIGAAVTLVFAGVSGTKITEIAAGILIVLISCGFLFYIGCLGGGDVKLLMVCGISIGWAMTRFLILSFICNGIYAVFFLLKRKSFYLRFSQLFQYVTQCKNNKRIMIYEMGETDSMIHFSLGILVAYIICLVRGGV